MEKRSFWSLVILGLLSLVSFSQALAQIDQEFTYNNVTRRKGGQEINEQLEVSSKNLMIEVRASSFDVILHDLTIYTVGTEELNLNDFKKDPRNLLSVDSQDRVVAKAGSEPVRVWAKTSNYINGVSLVVESLGGFADLGMKVTEASVDNHPPPTPQPPPVLPPRSPQPPDQGDVERACRERSANASGGLVVCSQKLYQATESLTFESNRTDQLRAALERINQPLNQCTNDVNSLQTELTQMRQERAVVMEQWRKSWSQYQQIRQQLRDSKEAFGRTAKCLVKGRRDTIFEGVGATQGAAMKMALERCSIMCGKQAWDPSYLCEYVRMK